MRSLVILSALLAVSYGAPQFLFILPQGFEQLTQGDTIPEIKPFNIEQITTSPAFDVPVIEETVAEVNVAVENEATSVLEAEPSVAVEPIPTVSAQKTEVTAEGTTDVLPVVDTLPAGEIIAVEEIAPVEEAAVEEIIPVEEVHAENVPIEMVVDVETAPVEEVIIVEASPVEEVSVPVEEIVAIEENLPAEEVIMIEESTPIEEIVIVEEMAAVDPVQQVTSTAAESVQAINNNEIFVDIVPSTSKAATVEKAPIREAINLGKSFSASFPAQSKIIPAPVVNQVDPYAHVDQRFRGFIYPNDSPDVIAAKIALFREHVARIPIRKPITV